jgi:hypothetical protein
LLTSWAIDDQHVPILKFAVAQRRKVSPQARALAKPERPQQDRETG